VSGRPFSRLTCGQAQQFDRILAELVCLEQGLKSIQRQQIVIGQDIAGIGCATEDAMGSDVQHAVATRLRFAPKAFDGKGGVEHAGARQDLADGLNFLLHTGQSESLPQRLAASQCIIIDPVWNWPEGF